MNKEAHNNLSRPMFLPVSGVKSTNKSPLFPYYTKYSPHDCQQGYSLTISLADLRKLYITLILTTYLFVHCLLHFITNCLLNGVCFYCTNNNQSYAISNFTSTPIISHNHTHFSFLMEIPIDSCQQFTCLSSVNLFFYHAY